MLQRLQEPVFRRRVIMTAAGVLLGGVPVGLFKASALGVDPFQAFCAGLNNVIPISFGTLYLLINLVLLIAMFFLGRSYIGLGTVLNLLFLGYVVEFSQKLVEAIFPVEIPRVRYALMVCAIPMLCFTASLYITADMGVSTYDVWALVLSKKTPVPFRLLRIITDFICVALGFVLLGFRGAGMLGIGTIISAFCMGPLIDLFSRKLAQPLMNRGLRRK